MTHQSDPTAGTPRSWSVTQQWLAADLDRNKIGPCHLDEPPPDYPEPTDLDVIDDDSHDLDDHFGQDATTRLHDGFDTDDRPEPLDNPTGATQCPPEGDDRGDNDTPAEVFGNLDDELTDPLPAAISADSAHAVPAPRFNKAVAVGFAAAVVVATVALTAVLLGMRTGPHTAADPAAPTTQISVLPAPPPAAAPGDADHDSPIPYTASASCPPGSTAAQSVAGNDPTRAWVCVRGGVDGQVLTLDLGRSMVITAISITPGWVGADASGADQWLQHRVVTRVQWIFDDNPATVVAQNTGSVHGDAVQPMPNRGVLAAKITMLVLQTSRAPADTPTTTPAAPTPGGILDSVLGTPAAPSSTPSDPADPGLPLAPGEQTQNDPADTTFAVSSIKVLGHPPQ